MVMVISAALRDPKVDPAKMMQLLELHRELERDVDRRAFTAHMSQLQAEISQIATDCNNPQTGSRYASYSALDKALRPFYTAHGFSVAFDTVETTRPDWVRVVCIVTRGAWETRHHADVKADQLGPKGTKVMSATHAGASALSYGKRYALAMAFNLAVARDDDGNAASARCITRSQVDELLTLTHAAGMTEEAQCKIWGIDNFAVMQRNWFDRAKTLLMSAKKETV